MNESCQLCRTRKPAVIDGKTIMGTWAFMCQRCHTQYGVGLGLGKGQKLERPYQDVNHSDNQSDR